MIVNRNSPIPQYYQLQSWLVEQIELGIFKPGDKIPTELEFVQFTGLCRATIRQAISALADIGYLERRRRFGTFVLKRAIEKTNQTSIGILVPDIRAACMAELARGAEDEAARNKHNIILCNTDDLYFKTEFYANRLIESGVSGVIYVPIAASDEKNKSIIEKFQKQHIPVVQTDRLVAGVEADFVTTDNFDGGYQVTDHLIRMGHKKIAILLSNLVSTERLRLEGYKKALQDHHIPLDDSLIFAPDMPYVENSYLKYAEQILSNNGKHLAVFAGHDQIALLFYSLAKDRNLSIPQDFSLVGYDDLPFLRSHPLSLTTIHQPIYEMGVESLKLLLGHIKGTIAEPQHMILKSHLVHRLSVKDLS